MASPTVRAVASHKTFYNIKLVGEENGLVSENVANQILLDLLRVLPHAPRLVEEWRGEVAVETQERLRRQREEYDARERRMNSAA